MPKVHIQTRINGEDIDFLCEPRQSLLEVLREDLGLTGTKEGCSNGNCGACSVLLDGVLVDSCLVLAVETAEHEVRYCLAGNLCRCTGYDKIVRAVLDAAAVMEKA